MFRKRPPSPQLPPEWMVVGLGNPGPEYRGTRHNVGFDALEALAAKHKIRMDKSKYQARFGIGTIDGVGVILVKPLTFMNVSGRAVLPLAKEHAIAAARVLVIADDLDLPVGRIRLRAKGSAGGHNGHKSLIQFLATEEYPRIKIGIGSVDRSETVNHVLGSFTPEERVDINRAIDRTTLGVETILTRGVEASLSMVNEGER